MSYSSENDELIKRIKEAIELCLEVEKEEIKPYDLFLATNI